MFRHYTIIWDLEHLGRYDPAVEYPEGFDVHPLKPMTDLITRAYEEGTVEVQIWADSSWNKAPGIVKLSQLLPKRAFTVHLPIAQFSLPTTYSTVLFTSRMWKDFIHDDNTESIFLAVPEDSGIQEKHTLLAWDLINSDGVPDKVRAHNWKTYAKSLEELAHDALKPTQELFRSLMVSRRAEEEKIKTALGISLPEENQKHEQA